MTEQPYRDIRWLPYRNDSGEIVPPYALVRISGVAVVNGQTMQIGEKPAAVSCEFVYGFNDGASVAVDGIGLLTFDSPAVAKVNTGATTTNNSRWSATTGQWYINLTPPTSSGYSLALGVIHGQTTEQGDTAIVDRRPGTLTLATCCDPCTAIGSPTPSATPAYLVTATGITDGTCTSCLSLNTTVSLTRFLPTAPYACTMSGSLLVCDAVTWTLTITAGSATTIIFTLQLSIGQLGGPFFPLQIATYELETTSCVGTFTLARTSLTGPDHCLTIPTSVTLASV